jgi:hypothetical protein
MIDDGSVMPQLDQNYSCNSPLNNITITKEDILFAMKKKQDLTQPLALTIFINWQ